MMAVGISRKLEASPVNSARVKSSDSSGCRHQGVAGCIHVRHSGHLRLRHPHSHPSRHICAIQGVHQCSSTLAPPSQDLTCGLPPPPRAPARAAAAHRPDEKESKTRVLRRTREEESVILVHTCSHNTMPAPQVVTAQRLLCPGPRRPPRPRPCPRLRSPLPRAMVKMMPCLAKSAAPRWRRRTPGAGCGGSVCRRRSSGDVVVLKRAMQ